MMKLCGLTGGVGMGKSTTTVFLRERGAKVVDADEIARELVQPGKPALAEIQNVFGKKIISDDGQLRRDELAKSGGYKFPASQTPWQEIQRSLTGQLGDGMVLENAVKYQRIDQTFGIPRDNH